MNTYCILLLLLVSYTSSLAFNQQCESSHPSSAKEIADVIEAQLPSRWPLDDSLAITEYYDQNPGNFENHHDFEVVKSLMATICAEITPTIMICGVNEGQSTSNILDHCPQARIHGFEIQDEEASIAANRFAKNSNVTIYHNGLSSRAGTYLVSGSGGCAGLYKAEGRWKDARQQGPVEVITANRFLQEAGLSSIDYFVIDVEGHEQDVIKGMQLEENAAKFPVFQYELGGTWADSRRTGPWTQFTMGFYLQLLGYDIYLMGYIDSKAVVLRTPPEFYRLSKGNYEGFTNGGQKYFVQGNALAVHTTYAPDYIRMFIERILVTPSSISQTRI